MPQPDDFRYTAGVYSVGQYQISGKPWASASIPVEYSSVLEITFPTVTKYFTVSNTNSGSTSILRVGFSENGVNGTNYFTLENGESYTGDLRVRSLYLRGDVAPTTASVIAGLTGIISELRTEFGPNYSGSEGIG